MLPESKTCLFVSNSRQEKNRKDCQGCLDYLFHRFSDRMVLIHERRFYLWRIINKKKTWSAMDHFLKSCVRTGPCKSMMLLPEMICSEHEQYSRKMMTEGVRINEKDMILFDRLTVGLWPLARIALNVPENFDDREFLWSHLKLPLRNVVYAVLQISKRCFY